MSDYNPEDITIEYLKPNKRLMEKLDIPEHTRRCLDDVYKQLTMVINRPDLYEDPVQHVEALEYTMQILWGFTPDMRQHNYWYRIKGCTCPSMDNGELTGTGRRLISGDCPFHGKYHPDSK